MPFGLTRQPVHPSIASHELRLRIQKHEYKTRDKERKAREHFEKDLVKAQAKHTAELTRIRAEEREKLKRVFARAKA